MNNNFQSLFDFVDAAEKNRKYGSNTATGLRVALHLFEPELNDQERESIETFKNNLTEIYQNVYSTNSKNNKLTAASLEIYRRRITSLIKDYETYAHDPAKMATWTRVIRLRGSRSKKKNENGSTNSLSGERNIPSTTELSTGITRFELLLRPNIKAIILTPSDLTVEEARKIKGYITYLESTAKVDDGGSGEVAE